LIFLGLEQSISYMVVSKNNARIVYKELSG